MLDTSYWREIPKDDIIEGMHIAAIKLDEDGLLSVFYGRVGRLYNLTRTKHTVAQLYSVTVIKRNFDRSRSLHKYLETGVSRHRIDLDEGYRFFQTKKGIDTDGAQFNAQS